jgi:hypothetical protein
MHRFCRTVVFKLRLATHQRGAKSYLLIAVAVLSVFFACLNIWKSSRCPAARFPSFERNTGWQYTLRCWEGECSDLSHHSFVYCRLPSRKSECHQLHVCKRRFLNFPLLKMKARHKHSGESDVLVGRPLDEYSRVGRDRE